MIIFSSIQRVAKVGCGAALCLGLAGLGLVTAVGPAQAAAPHGTSSAVRFAAGATPHQNAVIDAQMAGHPGGVRVSPSEVKWPGGVMLRVAASRAATPICPAGYFCVYPAPYSGSWYLLENATLYGGAYPFPWGECSPVLEPGCDAGIHAYANNTGDRVWFEQYPASGNEQCISNRTQDLNYNGSNDTDYWIYVSQNPNPCP